MAMIMTIKWKFGLEFICEYDKCTQTGPSVHVHSFTGKRNDMSRQAEIEVGNGNSLAFILHLTANVRLLPLAQVISISTIFN